MVGRHRAGARGAPFGTQGLGLGCSGSFGAHGFVRVWGQELGSATPVGPFQLGRFRGSGWEGGEVAASTRFPQGRGLFGDFLLFLLPGSAAGEASGPRCSRALPVPLFCPERGGQARGRAGGVCLSPPFASNTAPAIKPLKIFSLAGHLQASPFSLPAAWARSWLLSGAVGVAGRAVS